MKYGYARVSTRDQNPDLQVDRLRQVGCEQIFWETASGAKSDRPVLRSLLERMHAGDVLVIWKLDRLGRSLRDLVDLVGTLSEKDIALKSLQDPIDTTNSQGRLVFNLFASLAEFERDLIVERTQAGLSAARARGRQGGRPKGLSAAAEKKAIAGRGSLQGGPSGREHDCREFGRQQGDIVQVPSSPGCGVRHLPKVDAARATQDFEGDDASRHREQQQVRSR